MSSTVRIAGAGAFGLSVALCLARKGVAVEVWDPAGPLENASGVAAGMLAAASEAALDPPGQDADADHAGLLLAAQELWSEFAAGLNLELDRSGALLPGTARATEETAARLSSLEGARVLGGREARALQPWLGPAMEAAVYVPHDWRLDPVSAVSALRAAVQAEGGAFRRERFTAEALRDAPVVIAAGYASRMFPLREAKVLSPIKGQVARLSGGPSTGPTVRTPGAYIAPQAGGAIVGATMEEGRDDATVDPEAIERLLAAAAAVVPGLAGIRARHMAGVRASTPDRLPLAGPSSNEGVFLATGARRNGWLLAPLVGRMVAAYLTGEDPGPCAARLDPRRFDR